LPFAFPYLLDELAGSRPLRRVPSLRDSFCVWCLPSAYALGYPISPLKGAGALAMRDLVSIRKLVSIRRLVSIEFSSDFEFSLDSNLVLISNLGLNGIWF
jgi:hypothetical protein